MRRISPLARSLVLVCTLVATFGPVTAVQASASVVRASTTSAPCKPGSGPKLRGKDFTNGAALPYSLRCADLTKAKLDEVDLTQKDLSGAILRGASLKEADLTQAYLEYADLREADFTSADLGQMRAKQADLRGAILTDAEAGQAEFPHADLTGAVLTRAVLTQANFTDAKLVNTDLNDATMGQIKGRKADFTDAKLHEAKLGQAQLDHSVFKNADLSEAEFTQADLEDADLTGANVDKASFIQADDLNLTGTRGTPVDVPDDAIRGAEPTTDTVTDSDIGDQPASQGSPTFGIRKGLSTGLVLVIVSGLGLGLTLLLWGVTHRRRERRSAMFVMARRAAEEDITRLGEEIDALDFEMKINQASGGPSHDWRAALDAYEAAKQVVSIARSSDELQAAASAVQHGRHALHQVRSRMV